MSNKTMLILMVLLIYTQAGSCIDGRLTSAWHWCSKIEKKDYYPIFKLAGAPRHPLSARKLGKGGARAAHHPDKNGMRGMHKQKVASRPWCAGCGAKCLLIHRVFKPKPAHRSPSSADLLAFAQQMVDRIRAFCLLASSSICSRPAVGDVMGSVPAYSVCAQHSNNAAPASAPRAPRLLPGL